MGKLALRPPACLLFVLTPPSSTSCHALACTHLIVFVRVSSSSLHKMKKEQVRGSCSLPAMLIYNTVPTSSSTGPQSNVLIIAQLFGFIPKTFLHVAFECNLKLEVPMFFSPFTLANFSFVNLVFIFRCSRSTTNPVCARRVNHLVCSLPLHRHSYIGFIFSFCFIDS